tara:strand:+ start:4923 stop:5945 length:1023 start_codon:yes stop_codon:yes gene_type:complete
MRIQHLEIDGFEKVIHAIDEKTGLNAFIAIHSTHLGPALGGTRIWKYDSDADALRDVLRLAKGMTYKNSLAELFLGGGKAVINISGTEKSTDLLRRFGDAVETLKGKYITAEDVGTTLRDMEIVNTVTNHVASLRGAGDPSPATAYGVLRAMEAAVNYVGYNHNLDEMPIAIQGIGNVGYALAEMLWYRGAKLFVTDLNEEVCEKARQELGATVVEPKNIYDTECEVFVPCALGSILNLETIQRLKCTIICGAANNQLANLDVGEMLHKMGIWYVPDYLANAGGVINIYREFGQVRTDFHTANIINDIYDRTSECFYFSEKDDKPTSVIANETAERRLKL